MAEIRGTWYGGGYKIAQGGVAYPSRPGGNARLSHFPTLGGGDLTIRQQFPGWHRIVQANTKA